MKCSFYCWLSDTMAWRTTNITIFVCVWKEFTVNSILFYVYVSTYMYMWIHVTYTNFHVSSGCLFVFCNYWRHFIRKEPHPPLSFFFLSLNRLHWGSLAFISATFSLLFVVFDTWKHSISFSRRRDMNNVWCKQSKLISVFALCVVNEIFVSM